MSQSILAKAGTVAALGALYLCFKKLRNLLSTAQPKDASSAFIRYERLTEIEDNMIRRRPSPVSTITWFRGDHSEAATILKARIAKIVELNPWLAGRIVKHDAKNCLAYSTDKNVSSTSILFSHLTAPIPSIYRGTLFEDLGKLLTEASILLKAGRCEFEGPLWKVTVLPCAKSPSSRFAVVVSMSHVAGDGHTFYCLYNQLMGSRPIQEMKLTRIATTVKEQEAALGKTVSHVSGIGMTISMIRGLLHAKLIAPWRGCTPQSHYFMVDADKIKLAKEKARGHASTVPFVSTNDILTSWFLQNSTCQHGFMAINFRNRLKGHTDAHAGNYENVLYYRIPDDTSPPTLIRQSLATLKRVVTTSHTPSCLELGLASVALISNWSSFAEDEVDLPECQEEVHLPLFDLRAMMPSTLALCVIFRASPKQLALFVSGTPTKLENILNAPFRAEKELF